MGIKRINIGIVRIGAGVVIIGLLLVSNGCSYIYNGNNKKIILEEDVRETLNKETNMQIQVQQLDLKLGEGVYFKPTFYYNGEVYGSVGKGDGIIDAKNVEEYPIGGTLKEHLYCLDKNNVLKETNKKVFNYPYGSNIIGCKWNQSDGKIFSINYLKEDEPKVLEELTEALKKIGPYNNLMIKEYVIDGNKKMFTIINNVNYEGFELYFYDVEKGELYKRKGEILNEEDVSYIPALKSFVHMDKNYKCYKVVFEEDTFDFKEYIDLKGFVKTEEATRDYSYVIPINEEEVLLMELGRFGAEGYETKMISTFNFTTNKYKQLFVADKAEQEHIIANYIGNVTSIGGPTLIIDTFEEENGFRYLKPKVRYLKKIEGSKLITLYNEYIQNEGFTLTPMVETNISENGEEIFLKKNVTEIENGVQTTKNVIYKKYVLGNR